MSFDEYEDAFVWRCDGCGLSAEIQRGPAPSWPALGDSNRGAGGLIEIARAIGIIAARRNRSR